MKINEFIPLGFALMIVIFLGVLAFKPSPEEKPIQFEVIGVTNSNQTNTLVSLHYECIKYCTSHLSSYTQQDRCWTECEKLGKEVC